MKGLAQARRRAGMSQAELADAMQVTRGSVANWETGASWPNARLLPKLAQLLGCTIEDLFVPQA